MEQSVHTARYEGKLKIHEQFRLENRSGKLHCDESKRRPDPIVRLSGREREKFKLVYGSMLSVKEGKDAQEG
ncbi:MAG: hypothetical protein IPK68_15905 [Bdellovibrionales bacterium]|nr:hypothetical protein [Bdellovibrionales bacterium]